jgi:hypothetical protein
LEKYFKAAFTSKVPDIYRYMYLISYKKPLFFASAYLDFIKDQEQVALEEAEEAEVQVEEKKEETEEPEPEEKNDVVDDNEEEMGIEKKPDN